jgi:hypothetical protein
MRVFAVEDQHNIRPASTITSEDNMNILPVGGEFLNWADFAAVFVGTDFSVTRI